MITTVSTSNEEILNNIKELYLKDNNFQCDITYSLGKFYKSIEQPTLKYDKYPQIDGVKKLDDFNSDIEDNSLDNIVCDPPFIVNGKVKSEKWLNNPNKGVMIKRFSAYETKEECFEVQKGLVDICYNKLKKEGLLIYKIQNCKSNYSEQIWTKTYLENYAIEKGFELIDEFIKINKSPLPIRGNKQTSARKTHSYFLIFKKKN